MKKIVLIAIIIVISCFPIIIKASSATIAVSNSSSSVVVGNIVKTTVTVSSAIDLGGWQFDLKYDTSKLRLTKGQTHILDSPDDPPANQKRKTYTFEFVATSSGRANINIANARVGNVNGEPLQVNLGSASVNIITQAELEATYSKNNFLKSLAIENYQLEPEFDKETLEYSVTLEPETTKINIIGEKEDAKASVMGLGEKEVADGNNRIEIIVTAQNGNQRVYIINAIVEELNPIEIEVDGQKYNLIRKLEQITCPSLFLVKTIEYKEEEIPVCFNEKNDLTLLVVKDEELRYFVLGDLFEYREIKNKLFVFFNLEFPEEIAVPTNYQNVKLTIDGHEVNGYRNNQFQDFYLIYGINIETGNKGIYQYDQKENTMQRFNLEKEEEKKEENHNILALIFASTTIILLMTTATMALKKKKSSGKNQNDLLL